MAGKHIKELIAAYHDRDDLAFRRAANAIIDEEEAKRHTALARDLRRLLASGGRSVPVSLDVLPDAPRDRDSGQALAEVLTPRLAGLDDLVFEDGLRARLQALVAEVRAWPAFDVAGVPRRNRLLLYGPPGNGKSSIAEALAAEVGWPLVRARIDSLVSSYLGETAANLRSLFDFARTTAGVVLIDEFDSLGKLRDDPSDHGELRRVVNTVLQLIDRYQGRGFIVAATNTPDVLDAALWRRFDEVIEVPAPDTARAGKLLARLLPRRDMDVVANDAAGRLKGLPYAAVEHAAHGALRRALLDGRAIVSTRDLSQSIEETIGRPWQ